MKFRYGFKPCQSQNQGGCFVPESAQPHRHKHRHNTLALMSHTHPERLVRRGWRGLAGVRSTWPPPLTAPCWSSQLSSVLSLLVANARIGCFLYGRAPSTHSSHKTTSSVDWCQMPSKICHKKIRNIHVSLTDDCEGMRLRISENFFSVIHSFKAAIIVRLSQ